MDFRCSLGVSIALATTVWITAAHAFDDSTYPNFSGVWRKPTGIGNQWDQTKPLGLAQEPPFTPEYQAVFESSLADIKAGGQGNDAPSRCVPFAMPRVMTVVFDMEIVITPAITYNVMGNPAAVNQSGIRSFCSYEDAVVRATTGAQNLGTCPNDGTIAPLS